MTLNADASINYSASAAKIPPLSPERKCDAKGVSAQGPELFSRSYESLQPNPDTRLGGEKVMPGRLESFEDRHNSDMNFLDFPHELRSEILALAVCSPVTPPANVSEGQRDRTDNYRGIWQLPRQTSTALPLLLVNKQINLEVKRILKYAPEIYHVDIMYLKDRGLWTTWSIPQLPRTQYIDCVYATFRPFEPEGELEPRFENSLDFRAADRGPPLGVWSFHFLLSQLFYLGPGFVGSPQEGSVCHYIYKKIVVDVQAPTDGVEHKSLIVNNRDYHKMHSSLGYFANHDNSAFPLEERLVKFMCDFLSILMGLNYHTMNYGVQLLENIQETIEFLVNGKPFRVFDIDARATHLDVGYFGVTPALVEERKLKYKVYKAWIDERRTRMKNGLELEDNRPVGDIM
ncbi:unnamed protein product [Clonostachys solani]|uniref:Uncharacterized protein n=1 Tax=Clonostachys solani TaxID=160281 RepID=A0A9N9Z7A8_9HYPO|nr:unnamed protein product [Clonostachys solani]